MLKAFFTWANGILIPKNDYKLEINSEPKSEIDNGHLELTMEEKIWLMDQTLSENIFEVFNSLEYSSDDSKEDMNKDSTKKTIEESREPFIDSILNKYGFVIVMEDVKGNVFGGFLRKRILSWKTNFVSISEIS